MFSIPSATAPSSSLQSFYDTKEPSERLNVVLSAIDIQPTWRAVADREMDYKDGNQLDSTVLSRQAELGIPPAIEPMIGPTIDDILGMEAKTRTDWRVIPDSDKSGEEVAEALSFKLSQAERLSLADKACSEAYDSQISVGVGWVEVSRCNDPFKYKYRCRSVHRNEIWWDWLSRENDLSDCRWLLRRRWTDIDIAKRMFPGNSELIEKAGTGWQGFDIAELDLDGGKDTGLAKSWSDERGWTREEQEWRDTAAGRVCLFELWYRVYEEIFYLTFSDGRVVEYDDENENHIMAAWAGIPIKKAMVGKMNVAFFAGPHLLHDGPSPYKHRNFPYIPFFGKREDRTGVPYGLIRGMMFLQDEINARVSKMQWLLSAKRVIRTEGAVKDEDSVFRAEVARPDADIKLDPEAMQQDGIFKIEQDQQLNNQQAARLQEARDSLRRVARVSEAFQGHDKTGRQSGSALATLVEQTVQGLADINDNYDTSRMNVGDTLLSLVVEDMKDTEEAVLLDGGMTGPDKTIVLNQMMKDPDTGMEYLNNSTERMKTKVVLNDVPSTPSFRAQQLTVMQEAFKSAPPEHQKIMMPHLMNLMDVPYKEKRDIIESIRKMAEVPTEEEIQSRVDEAVKSALQEKLIAQKERELDIKEKESDAKVEKLFAEVGKIIAEEVRKNVESVYASVQSGREIIATPEVADSADQILKSAGFEDKDAPPIVDQFGAGVGGEQVLPPEPSENTSPTSPPLTEEVAPVETDMPMEGLEAESPLEGGMEGIEEPGTQL